MGQTCRTTCNACGRDFTVRDGGGFFFLQVRCEACGKSETLPFKEPGDRAKLRETGFGECSCGGKMSEDAKPRCPFCRSDDLELGEVEIYYD